MCKNLFNLKVTGGIRYSESSLVRELGNGFIANKTYGLKFCP